MQRNRAQLHVGNIAQLAGAGTICYGIDLLAGVAISLIVAGAFVVALANFEYDATVIRIPLPHLHRFWGRQK